jgi:hypothetical protein
MCNMLITFVRTVPKQHATSNVWILLFLLNTFQIIIILYSLHDHHCISILIFFWHLVPSTKCDISTHVTWFTLFRSEYYKRQKLVYTSMVLSICSFTHVQAPWYKLRTNSTLRCSIGSPPELSCHHDSSFSSLSIGNSLISCGSEKHTPSVLK